MQKTGAYGGREGGCSGRGPAGGKLDAQGASELSKKCSARPQPLHQSSSALTPHISRLGTVPAVGEPESLRRRRRLHTRSGSGYCRRSAPSWRARAGTCGTGRRSWSTRGEAPPMRPTLSAPPTSPWGADTKCCQMQRGEDDVRGLLLLRPLRNVRYRAQKAAASCAGRCALHMRPPRCKHWRIVVVKFARPADAPLARHVRRKSFLLAVAACRRGRVAYCCRGWERVVGSTGSGTASRHRPRPGMWSRQAAVGGFFIICVALLSASNSVSAAVLHPLARRRRTHLYRPTWWRSKWRPQSQRWLGATRMGGDSAGTWVACCIS